jgi:SAM-dependent methyltransferase
MTEKPENAFDEYYYQMGCGRPYQRDEEWLHAFDLIAERIIEEIHPRSVLDAGCAMGFLVEALRKRGVEAFGVDISEYAISKVDPSISEYCWAGSITDPFPQHYDLIVTIEVLEHMPKEAAESAVENFCRFSNDVLFSSGDQDLREVTHVNLHPAEYWASLFAKQSFFRDVDFDASFITPWTVRFRKNSEPIHRIIQGYERQINRILQENVALHQVNLEQRGLLAQKEGDSQKLSAQLTHANTQLSEIYNNKAYQLSRRIAFLLPPGSRWEKFISGIWNAAAKLKR